MCNYVFLHLYYLIEHMVLETKEIFRGTQYEDIFLKHDVLYLNMAKVTCE